MILFLYSSNSLQLSSTLFNSLQLSSTLFYFSSTLFNSLLFLLYILVKYLNFQYRVFSCKFIDFRNQFGYTRDLTIFTELFSLNTSVKTPNTQVIFFQLIICKVIIRCIYFINLNCKIFSFLKN